MKNKFIAIAGIIFVLGLSLTFLATKSSAEPTEAEQKKQRLAEIQTEKMDNSAEYQKLIPLAAKSRTECVLLDARERQLKYLNGQNNGLRDEEEQLVHDLKIMGVDPTKSLK